VQVVALKVFPRGALRARVAIATCRRHARKPDWNRAILHDRDGDFPLEELRRDLEPDLARDLEAVFGASRLVDLRRARALFGVFRLLDVFPAAEVSFFRPLFRLWPEPLPELFDAAPIRAPEIAPVRAPASARLKTPPVFFSARFAVSATAPLVDLLFLFAICLIPGGQFATRSALISNTQRGHNRSACHS
jgi:hypothetical protein